MLQFFDGYIFTSNARRDSSIVAHKKDKVDEGAESTNNNALTICMIARWDVFHGSSKNKWIGAIAYDFIKEFVFLENFIDTEKRSFSFCIKKSTSS